MAPRRHLGTLAPKRRVSTRLLLASLAVCCIETDALGQGPSSLKWWSSSREPVQTVAGQDTVNDSRRVRTAAASDRAANAPTVNDRTDLRWWDAKAASGELKSGDLNWWSANSTANELGWWNASRPAPTAVTAQAQDNPFAPQRRPNDQPAPTPNLQPRVAPDDGRTTGAAGIDFDPFGVVPRIRPLREINASLSPDPVIDDPAAVEPPPFAGTAEEYFAQRGSVFLAPRVWPNRTPEAAAYCFYSRPLWYEDANLERCGYTVGCLQPVVSGTYFFANTALLPYRFAAEPQCTVVPQKGFCAPGCRYTHRDNYLPPWSPAGAIAEAAAVTGLVFLIP